MTQKPLSPQRSNYQNERVVEQRLLLTMANGCYPSLISASVTEHHDTSNAGEEQHLVHNLRLHPYRKTKAGS